MSQPIGFSTKLRGWEVTKENVTPHLPEMPYVEPLVTELDGVIVEGRSLHNEQQEALARLQDITHRRQEIERRGELLRRRIASHLRGTFGFVSDELLKFGIKPRPRVTRKAKKKKEGAGSGATTTTAAGSPPQQQE